jgi:predicted SprT family Zn-dependent metalloprotease
VELESIFQDLNRIHFEAELPLPRLNWNSRLSSAAGRFCPGRVSLGQKALIEIASYLKGIDGGIDHIRDTMLHEMIHYWLWHKKRPYGHTAEFRQIMRRTGAKRYNPVPKLRPVKYRYQCPECLVTVPARRRLADVACAACCKKFNAGVYSKKYRLKPLGQESLMPDEPVDESLLILPFDKVMDTLKALRETIRSAKIRTS